MNLGNFLDLCPINQSIHLYVDDGETKELTGTAHALLSLLDDVFLKDFEVVLFRTDPIENEAIEVEAKPMKGK